MPARHVVVDGSNLATEGRSMPSLAQLDQGVREFLAEHPKDLVTVVVDASFGHRIDPSELATFEEAEEAGEIISPPAGAIGRGDAFLLRIAEKTGATVLSNDSFQEFHGDHPWLFDKGRLIGGKPVPGVGWIFMERSPVRGQKSREVVKEAKRRKKAGDTEQPEQPEPASGLDLAAARAKSGRPKSVDRAIARATQEVVEPKSETSGRRRRGGRPPSDPVNEPLAFITFIAAHPLGTEVVGTVTEYSSHGAVVTADGAHCYMPLSAMGNPPPRKAREVVTKGETGLFVVQAFDPLRRGIELALPGFATIAAVPTPETVEAEIRQEGADTGRRARKSKKATAVAPARPGEEEAEAPKKRASAKKAGTRKKSAATEITPARKSPAKKAPTAKKAAAAEAAPVPKQATETAAAPKKAAAAKKAPAAKKASAAKKAPAVKNAPAAKEPAAKKAAAAGNQASAVKNAPAAKKAAAKKSP
jgi:hypothetical protein